MIEEVSAGGVVIFGNTLLLLKKNLMEIGYCLKEEWRRMKILGKQL